MPLSNLYWALLDLMTRASQILNRAPKTFFEEQGLRLMIEAHWRDRPSDIGLSMRSGFDVGTHYVQRDVDL
jgi:hypothetical protein